MRQSLKNSIILLSIDDLDEQFIFSNALKESRQAFQIYPFQTAKELLSHLRHLSCLYSEKNLENFTILAELKLPFFEWQDISAIRAIPCCKKIPVHVFAERHLQVCPLQAKSSGATAFYNKPQQLTEFRDLLSNLLSKNV